MEHLTVTANGAACETVHVRHMLLGGGDVLVGNTRLQCRFLDHPLPKGGVRPRKEQHALGFESVSSRPPGFLLIMLHRFRHGCVQDKTHIRAIDPHAESHRGHHDITFLLGKGVLGCLALLPRR